MSTTLITLKCPNCSANLEIRPEASNFACGYCGANQIVERFGGTISLKLVSEAISKVQVATDKTASELAIRRLKDEYNELDASYRQSQIDEGFELAQKERQLKIGLVVGILFCAFIGGQSVVLGAIGFCVLIVFCIGHYRTSNSEISSRYEQRRLSLRKDGREIDKKIAFHRSIVDKID